MSTGRYSGWSLDEVVKDVEKRIELKRCPKCKETCNPFNLVCFKDGCPFKAKVYLE